MWLCYCCHCCIATCDWMNRGQPNVEGWFRKRQVTFSLLSPVSFFKVAGKHWCSRERTRRMKLVCLMLAEIRLTSWCLVWPRNFCGKFCWPSNLLSLKWVVFIVLLYSWFQLLFSSSICWWVIKPDTSLTFWVTCWCGEKL